LNLLQIESKKELTYPQIVVVKYSL
jgi:hypothetical protein